MKTIKTDVLAVGAAPAGLTAIAPLARARIDALTITKYAALPSTPLSCRKDPRKTAMTTMNDLKADWRKWTRAEKWLAISFVFSTSTILPALFLFGQG